jgi:hypothetical protein
VAGQRTVEKQMKFYERWVIAASLVLVCSVDVQAQNSSTSCTSLPLLGGGVWTECNTTGAAVPPPLPVRQPDYRPPQPCYYAGARLVCP